MKKAIEKLTLENVSVRAVKVPLRRPIIAGVGRFDEWPAVLIDVKTKEGVIGRSFLEPYVEKLIGSIAEVLNTLSERYKGQILSPLDIYNDSMNSMLHLNGREGTTLIGLSGFDMAIWDALARASDVPLVTLLGGSPGPLRTYN